MSEDVRKVALSMDTGEIWPLCAAPARIVEQNTHAVNDIDGDFALLAGSIPYAKEGFGAPGLAELFGFGAHLSCSLCSLQR